MTETRNYFPCRHRSLTYDKHFHDDYRNRHIIYHYVYLFVSTNHKILLGTLQGDQNITLVCIRLRSKKAMRKEEVTIANRLIVCCDRDKKDCLSVID